MLSSPWAIVSARRFVGRVAQTFFPPKRYGTADTSPPSTCRETHVMYEAAGEGKKATTLPSSAGSP